MELLQVVQCRAGRGKYVAAIVAKGVLLQVVGGACRGHELPHAGGLRAGDGQRIEGAFDVGQKRQLGGHVAPLQLFDDVKEIFA